MHAILSLVLVIALHPQPSGSIAGRVTFEDSGEPADEVTVECVARGGSPTERVPTDAEGRYQCRVPPGIYRVRAHLTRLDTVYLSQTYGVRGHDDEGVGIRVRAGGRVDVPFVLRRSGTISGRVLDDQGVPLKYAIVTAQRESPDDPGFSGFSIGDSRRPGIRPLERAATIEGGRFFISGLAPGVYRLSAEPPERAVTPDGDGRRLVPTWYPSAVDPRYAVPVQVNGDDLAGVELVLARSRMPSIRGFVFLADGSRAAGLQVRLMAGNAGGFSSLSVTSGVKGEFRFESVTPGSYQLAAQVSDRPAEMTSSALVVGDADISDVVLSLLSGPGISGRVRFEGDGFPRGSVNVDAVGIDPLAFGSRATTDAKGGFVLPPIIGSGARLLRVSALPKGWWLKSVIAARRDITNDPVDLADGLEGIDILVSNRMSTVSGVVEAIEAVAPELPADSAVLVFSDDSSKWVAGSSAVVRVWPTEEGSFLAEGLPAGAYRVIAIDVTPPGFLRAVPDVLRSLSERATLIRLGDGERLQVKIPLVRQQ